MKTIIWGILVSAMTCTGCGGAARDSSSPKTSAQTNLVDEPIVYTDATIYTMDPKAPLATGLRVEKGTITHVLRGQLSPTLSGRVVSLKGAVVLPGLTDAHLHLQGLGMAARQLDLRGTKSVEEILARVRDAGRGIPAGAWIRGRGWDQNDWPSRSFPSRASLDAVSPNHPVWLTRIDGHAVCVNSKAMELAGLGTQTQSPPGGEILRDDQGRPTGVLVDNAIELVEKKLPAISRQEIRLDLEKGMELCRQSGLTSVHDMGTEPRVLEELHALEAEGKVSVRVFSYLGGAWEAVAPLLRTPPDRTGLVQVVGIKLFADGALGSRGAALLVPYSDQPNTSGLIVTSEDDLKTRTLTAHRAGYQVAIHAIGDRANAMALSVIASAQGQDHSRGHRVEHVQVLAPADVPRFASLGVVASMQPTHATSDMDWAEARLGAERVRGAYAWRSLWDTQALVAFGSDAPIERENPWLGIYAAVTRQDTTGKPANGWFPEQRLTLQEAMLAFTRNPARAVQVEGLGVIREGAAADLSVIDQDPFRVPVLRLPSTRTLRTIVNGREVYVAD